MELINIKAIIAAAIVNVIIGFTWYNPKVFGEIWMREANLDREAMKKMNMKVVFGSTFIFAFMLAFSLPPLVIHQMGLGSILMNELNSPDFAVKTAATADLSNFMGKYGNNFRSFKHGAFHGLIYTIFLILPVVGMNSLYENRSWKYIAIHVGYWATCLMLMGGIVCAWQ
jgi:Protein of unknown function (DUF1761)